MSTYTDNGYKDRNDYLKYVAGEYGAPLRLVYKFALIFGPAGDFGSLLDTLSSKVGAREPDIEE